jgi:hypothetical protein
VIRKLGRVLLVLDVLTSLALLCMKMKDLQHDVTVHMHTSRLLPRNTASALSLK